MVIYLLMILIYLTGIFGFISHAAELVCLYATAGSLFFFLLILRRDRNKSEIAAAYLSRLKSPGLWVFLCLSVCFTLLTLHLRVTNWDDYHYWAIFPKNIAAINGVPTGGMSCTLYRDYLPIIQFFDYLVFKLTGGFREASMFSANYLLIYLSLTPFFIKRQDQSLFSWICSVITGILLPFICSFQMLHCLGVDVIMTFLFSACIIWIFDGEDNLLFYYGRLAVATTVLSLTKTMGLWLSVIVILLLIIKRAQKTRSFCLGLSAAALCNLLFPFSWQLFCRARGNTSYLSGNLSLNITDGLRPLLPSYGADTIRSFFRALFTLPLNEGRFGMSAICMLLIGILLFFLYSSAVKPDRRFYRMAAGLLGGLILYLIGILYTYLFIFEEWEASSLSSFDRYITTYFGALLTLGLFLMFRLPKQKPFLYAALILFFLFTLNYSYMGQTLVPSGFKEAYGEQVRQMDMLENRLQKIFSDDMHYGEHILFVAEDNDDGRDNMLPYCSVPYVVKLLSYPEGTSLTTDEILDSAGNFNAEYVIFLDDMGDYRSDMIYIPGENGLTQKDPG